MEIERLNSLWPCEKQTDRKSYDFEPLFSTSNVVLKQKKEKRKKSSFELITCSMKKLLSCFDKTD